MEELDLGQTIRGFVAGQKVFGRYVLKAILGRGGMGIVWRAFDEHLDRDVALKFLPELVIHDRVVLDDLKRETKRNLDLTHHHIVRIYDFAQDTSSACISMEFVDGETLSALRLDRPDKVFQADDLLQPMSELCEALTYAHTRASIVHRDLKPANLMLTSKGLLKVTDFGIARSLSDSISMLTMNRSVSGTLLYMSPQQLDGDRASALDDIYSIGATVYELLTSRPPFYTGSVERQIHEKTAPPMGVRRSDLGIVSAITIPEHWEHTVAACLAKDPEQRPQSAAALAERFRGVPIARPVSTSAASTVAAPTIESPPISSIEGQPKGGSKRLFYAGAAAAGVLLLGGAAIFLSLRSRKEPTIPPDQTRPIVTTAPVNSSPVSTPTAAAVLEPSPAAKASQESPTYRTSSLDLTNMDISVRPQDDFYLYANGGWIKRNPVPPAFSRWASFNELAEKNNEALRTIAENATTKVDKSATSADAGSADVRLVADFYASGMDEAALNRAKARPLQDELNKINALTDRKDLMKQIGRFHSMGLHALFGFASGQDDKDSTRIIAQAFQGGLGLPDRDYYTKQDQPSKGLRQQYVEHIAKMFTLMEESASQATTHAQKVLAIETSLAKQARTRSELRDPQRNYNKMSLAQLQALTPDFNWTDYLIELKLTNPGDINVGQPDFFKAANELLKTTSLDEWKAYLRWHLIKDMAPMLSSDFVNENFRFYEATLRGAKEIKPRWKRVVAKTDEELGEALGKLYVAEHFPPEAKARAMEMVNNLKEAFADRIMTLDWMDQATKDEALKKLAALKAKIGYPDKWRDYSTLKIDRTSYAQNVLRADLFELDRLLKKIGKPIDRSEWGMSPPTVNAYYNPNMNEIVFPAGLMQPPFFDWQTDDAMNYGGMGAVIGHEMTHGFDDQGRQFDAMGNLRDWWTPQSAKAYDGRRKFVVAQYSAYEPLPGQHINGELTQGENIADIGGVKLAYSALQKAIAKKGPQPKIDGFTPEQRFFLGFAQIWRNTQRDEDLKLRLNTDPHSPGRFRTIGPVSNLGEFQKAFDIPDGSPMIRPADQRVDIW
jgi:putative endopeptidase